MNTQLCICTEFFIIISLLLFLHHFWLLTSFTVFIFNKILQCHCTWFIIEFLWLSTGGSMLISAGCTFFLFLSSSQSAIIALQCLFSGVSVAAWNGIEVVTVELYPASKRYQLMDWCSCVDIPPHLFTVCFRWRHWLHLTFLDSRSWKVCEGRGWNECSKM